jgi:hypothetical protein
MAATPIVQAPAEIDARRSLPLAKRLIPCWQHGLRAKSPTAAGDRLLIHRHWKGGTVSPIDKVDGRDFFGSEKSFRQVQFS